MNNINKSHFLMENQDAVGFIYKNLLQQKNIQTQ